MSDNRMLRELLEKFVTYENWILSGFPKKGPSLSPDEYSHLFKQNPNAYGYYRQALYLLIKHLLGSDEIVTEFIRLFDELKTSRANLFGQLLDYINTSELYCKCKVRWTNAYQISRAIDKPDITQAWVLFYQSKYEIEEILLILAMVRRVITDNVFDSTMENLKDGRGMYRKGVMVDYVASGLSAYPVLQNVIRKAYIPRLRNTIGHNNYKLENGLIRSLDNSITVSKDEFYEAVYCMQEIHNSIIWSIVTLNDECYQDRLRDCGVASIGFVYDEVNQKACIDLFQLWCFYELDTTKQWLESVELKVVDDKLSTTFTSIARFSGPLTTDLEQWLKGVRKSKKVGIRIWPIIPYIGDQHLKIDLGWGKYQLDGDCYAKELPVVIN